MGVTAKNIESDHSLSLIKDLEGNRVQKIRTVPQVAWIKSRLTPSCLDLCLPLQIKGDSSLENPVVHYISECYFSWRLNGQTLSCSAAVNVYNILGF